MSITCAATKVFDAGPYWLDSGGWGVIAQADGSYLWGFSESDQDYPYEARGHWYRSIDNGRTWTSVGQTVGLYGGASSFPSNIHSNIVCAPYYDSPALITGIMRSVDGAANWASVFSAQSAASPNGREPDVVGVQSFNRTAALAWGQMSGDSRDPPQLIALSTNGGLTWTPQNTWDVGDQFDRANALGVAEDGTIYCQYTKFGGVNRQAWLARTTNYAVSWNVRSTMGSISAPPWPNVQAIVAFDKETIAMGGYRGDIPTSSNPGAWWSDDGGTTIHTLSASDIVNWPGGSGAVPIHELKFLTQDAALMAFEVQNGQTPQSCWAISIDQGHTYPIAVTQVGGSANYQIPFGKAVVTRDGAALLALWQSDDYETARVTLWRAPIVCD